MKNKIFLLIISLAIMVGYSLYKYNSKEINFEEEKRKVIQQYIKNKHPLSSMYTVLKKEEKIPYKRSLDILLKEKITIKQLEKLAYYILKQYPNKVDKTFILYYLDGDKYPWASTHFDPKLKINILGVSYQDEKIFLVKQHISSQQEIGKWEDTRNGRLIRLYIENNILKSEIMKNGTLYILEMHQYYNKNGIIKFIEKFRINNELGEYYLLTQDKKLQYWSKMSGNYYTAKKIQSTSSHTP